MKGYTVRGVMCKAPEQWKYVEVRKLDDECGGLCVTGKKRRTC